MKSAGVLSGALVLLVASVSANQPTTRHPLADIKASNIPQTPAKVSLRIQHPQGVGRTSNILPAAVVAKLVLSNSPQPTTSLPRQIKLSTIQYSLVAYQAVQGILTLASILTWTLFAGASNWLASAANTNHQRELQPMFIKLRRAGVARRDWRSRIPLALAGRDTCMDA